MNEKQRTLGLQCLLAVSFVLAIYWLTRSLVTQPIVSARPASMIAASQRMIKP